MLLLLLILLACSRGDADGPPGDSAEPGVGEDVGVVVLAGGGSEGELGEEDAWSAGLYAALLAGGDITGDGEVRVAILSAAEETGWLPSYFEWLGADLAENVQVADADTAATTDLSEADAVFIKGGDQGVYYDAWQGTGLDDDIRACWTAGGGVGGTSAGAMSLSAYTLAGGQDYVSDDVLADAQTRWLDDTDGGSSIHDDFLALVPGALVDTHFTERGRLGRLVGAMAKARAEGAPDSLLGVGIEQRTGMVIDDGVATVRGEGGVVVLYGGTFDRPDGAPLQARRVSMEVLLAGAAFDTATGEVLTLPDGAQSVEPTTADDQEATDWSLQGDEPADEAGCQWQVSRPPDAYSVEPGTLSPRLNNTACFTLAHDSDGRAVVQEAALATLAAQPGSIVLLVAEQSALYRKAAQPDELRFGAGSGSERATLVIDGRNATWTATAGSVSNYDAGDGSLFPAGVGGLELSVLADSEGTGEVFDLAE
jgi:cyanophycinase